MEVFDAATKSFLMFTDTLYADILILPGKKYIYIDNI